MANALYIIRHASSGKFLYKSWPGRDHWVRKAEDATTWEASVWGSGVTRELRHHPNAIVMKIQRKAVELDDGEERWL